VTSSGVWPGETRMDTHRPRSSSDRPARKCGVSASDPLHVSDTFMAMARSVSVISRRHDNATVGVNDVPGCTQMIPGCPTD
jgi:hypothetical protein